LIACTPEPRSGDDGYVSCLARVGPLGAGSIVKHGLQPALAKAELPHLRWRDLRHPRRSP
jgi:hypothetical protein